MDTIQDKIDFDYSFVANPAQIAVYDDMLSAPRVLTIPPQKTAEFIENLASSIYEQVQKLGGEMPYTVIREVSENFIHAQFKEIVVSILEKGNVIRFADQGPGVSQKEKAQLPGFTSANEQMKSYIRGVGSGLPLVKEYLKFTNGTINIEDNLIEGAVITITLQQKEDAASSKQVKTEVRPITPPLSQREKDILIIFSQEGALGVTEISKLTDTPGSTTHKTLQSLEESGLIERTTIGKKRILTDIGYQVVQNL